MKRLALITSLLFLAITVITILPVQAKTKLKLATLAPSHHAYTMGAEYFARLVKEGTNGAVIIKVYGGGQLGKGERELLEGLQLGIIDLAVTSTGPISNFSEDMGVIDLPFLFTSNEHVDKVLDGPIGQRLLDGLEKAKIKGLSFFENGFRNFTNSKRPLLKPEDFKGLKFRTMENPVHLASVRQLGAQAVPMSWGETYTSLQTGVIDGQENPIAVIYAFKLSEVQKYLSLTGHFYSPAPLTMSLRKFKALKPEFQKIFQDAALKSSVYARELIRDNEVKQLEDLKAQGMEISEVDKSIFIKAMSPVYDKFCRKHPTWKDVLKQIRATK